jgi:hypothetical protein
VRNILAGSRTELRTGGDALEPLQLCSICDREEIFLTSKFSYVVRSNLKCKTKTGTANRWEITNSNPLASTIMIGESGTRSNRQIIFITLFFSLAGARLLLCLIPSWVNCKKMAGQKHFAESKGHVWTFLHPILTFPESHTEHWWSPSMFFLWCMEIQSPGWVYEHGYLIGCMTLMGWWYSTSITVNQFEVWSRLDREQS